MTEQATEETYIYEIKTSCVTERPVRKKDIQKYYVDVAHFLAVLKDNLTILLKQPFFSTFVTGEPLTVLEAEVSFKQNESEYLICDVSLVAQSPTKLFEDTPKASIISKIQNFTEKALRQFEHMQTVYWDCSYWEIYRVVDGNKKEGQSSGDIVATLLGNPMLLAVLFFLVIVFGALFFYTSKQVDKERRYEPS